MYFLLLVLQRSRRAFGKRTLPRGSSSRSVPSDVEMGTTFFFPRRPSFESTVTGTGTTFDRVFCWGKCCNASVRRFLFLAACVTILSLGLSMLWTYLGLLPALMARSAVNEPLAGGSPTAPPPDSHKTSASHAPSVTPSTLVLANFTSLHCWCESSEHELSPHALPINISKTLMEHMLSSTGSTPTPSASSFQSDNSDMLSRDLDELLDSQEEEYDDQTPASEVLDTQRLEILGNVEEDRYWTTSKSSASLPSVITETSTMEDLNMGIAPSSATEPPSAAAPLDADTTNILIPPDVVLSMLDGEVTEKVATEQQVVTEPPAAVAAQPVRF